jgi:hypothetical protein
MDVSIRNVASSVDPVRWGNSLTPAGNETLLIE